LCNGHATCEDLNYRYHSQLQQENGRRTSGVTVSAAEYHEHGGRPVKSQQRLAHFKILSISSKLRGEKKSTLKLGVVS
jgi:hypothetical protein